MDYQTFNSPQHLPPSFGGPFSTSSAPSHSPQQAQSYQDPQARLQHPANASFPYQHFANGQPPAFAGTMPPQAAQATSGAVMQPGGLSQSQLQMHQARGKRAAAGHPHPARPILCPMPYALPVPDTRAVTPLRRR